MFKWLKEWWNSEEANRKIEWRELIPKRTKKNDLPPLMIPPFKMFQGNPKDLVPGDKVGFYFINDPSKCYVGEIHADPYAPGFIVKTTSRDPMQTRYIALNSSEISYRKLTREEYFYYMMAERLPHL